jgi:WD40 repeat protein
MAPGGKTLVTLGGADGLRVWDMPGLKPRPRPDGPETGMFDYLHFALGGRAVVTLTNGDHCVRLWDARTGRQTATWPTPFGQVLAVAPDGRLVAHGDNEGQVRLREADTGKERPPLEAPRPLAYLAFSPDGRLLAGYDGRALVVWDVARPRPLYEVEGAQSTLWPPVFSPDGSLLAAGWPLGGVAVRDSRTGRERRSMSLSPKSAAYMAFSADGRSLAAVAGRQWRAWDVATGDPMSVPPPVPGPGIHGASPDGRTLLTGDGRWVHLV